MYVEIRRLLDSLQAQAAPGAASVEALRQLRETLEHAEGEHAELADREQAARADAQAGRTEFLAGWQQALQRTDMRDLIRPSFQSFLDGFRTTASPPNAAAMMSDAWVSYRAFLAYLTYMHVNVVANPGTFNHARLNQRLDLHYLALTGPGMCLVTRDSEMAALAAVVSPRGRTIGDLSEVDAL